jgi:4-alpha-glucanotransferase
MQDLLELDGVHRMNVPGTAAGNWTWRFAWDMVPEGLSQKVRRMVEIYGR